MLDVQCASPCLCWEGHSVWPACRVGQREEKQIKCARILFGNEVRQRPRSRIRWGTTLDEAPSNRKGFLTLRFLDDHFEVFAARWWLGLGRGSSRPFLGTLHESGSYTLGAVTLDDLAPAECCISGCY